MRAPAQNAALAAALLAALALAACQEGTVPEGETAEPPAETSAEAVAVGTWTGGPLVVAETGVGPVDGLTRFDRDEIQRRFPNAKVETGFLQFGDNSTAIVTVQQDELVLELQPTADLTVGTVLVQGGPAEAPGGLKLMTKWAEARMAPERCRMGEGRAMHAVVCRPTDDSRLSVIFAVPGWTSDAMPPAATLNEKAFVREFVWSAPTS